MKFYSELLASICTALKNCSFNALLEWLMVQTFYMAISEESYVVYNGVAHTVLEILIQHKDIQKINNKKMPGVKCLKVVFLLLDDIWCHPCKC